MSISASFTYSQIHEDNLVQVYSKKFESEFNLTKLKNDSIGIAAIEILEGLKSHEQIDFRNYAHFKIMDIAVRSNSQAVKAKAVNSILKFSRDPYVAIRGNNANFYEAFPKEVYRGDFVIELKSVLHNDSFVNRGHILLVGFLGLTEEKAYLENHILKSKGRFLNDYNRQEINRFGLTTRMALARLGEKEHLDYVIQKIMDASEKDILRKRIKYLAYIKQPEAIEIMFDYLFMDKLMPDVTGWERTYANYVIPYIYQSVKGFPITNNGWFGYSEEEIEEARDWVTKHKNSYEVNQDVW